MMKAILCLSFVCCFVAVALATCECGKDMIDCASEDANKHVIRAKVKSDAIPFYYPTLDGVLYKISTTNFYKGKDIKFKYVYLSADCGDTLVRNQIYFLMGRNSNKKYNGKKLLEIRKENYWMKESVTVSGA